MAGVFVIFASLIGFAGSLTLWALGMGLMGSVLTGYGLSAVACSALVLRQARRIGDRPGEDFSAYRGAEGLRSEPRAVPLRH